MKGEIIEIVGVARHWETDHTEKDMSKLVGAIVFRFRHQNGLEEELTAGVRPGETNEFLARVIAEAQNWRNAGGVIPEWVEPTAEEARAAMTPLTARQFRLGLLHSGTTEDEVAAIISQIPDPTERAVADIEWRTAELYERTHPLVVQVGETLGYTPEVTDSLWNFYLTI